MLTENIPEIVNPYPTYRALRHKTPIYQDKNGTWHFTRYNDIKLLLTDNRFVRQHPESSSYIHQKKIEMGEVENVLSHWLLFSDPPYHTRLKKNFGRLFNPIFIKETSVQIELAVNELLENLLKLPHADFMQVFAFPLPVQVLNGLLGTSFDTPGIRKWSLPITKALNHGAPSDLQEIIPVFLEIQNYFSDLIKLYENKSTRPSDTNWIAKLMDSNAEDPLNRDEIVVSCIFLLMAAHETVQLTLGLGLRAFLQNPDQILLLQENPKLVNSAVEEILRFETPLNKLSRWTNAEVKIDNVCIPQNQLVVGLLNAAHRDPTQFSDPEKFDITRTNNQHLAFGMGIHNCLGGFLARSELQIAFTKLTPYLHKFSLAKNEPETWMPFSALRYLYTLMVDIK